MSRLNEIHDYLIGLGKEKEVLEKLDGYSVYLCMEIVEYAHRNQKRENGEDYANHPFRCLKNYQDLVGIVPDDYFCIDKDMMYENGIPFDGVQEVCLLHDVIEDTDFTLGELEEIFDECELGDFFRMYIKKPLKLITHDKEIDYLSYITICMEHPIAAICKMMDLQDNLYVLSLTEFGNENYKRALDYLSYIYLINAKYQFIENVQTYKREFAEEK